MPHPAKKSEEEALPDPELNPLLNPILGAHMGRWAEVYFTSPPEKRGEAVAELLRELQSSPPPQGVTVRTENEPYPAGGSDRGRNPIEEETHAQDRPTEPSSLGDLLTCTGCGYQNVTGQMFCGMCGAPLKSTLQMLGEAEAPAGMPHPPRSQGRWSESQPSVAEDSRLENASLGTVDSVADSPPFISPIDVAPVVEDHIHERYQPWPPAEPELPGFAIEAETVPYRYRIYVGAGLAILLGVLLYMAWRGTTTFSGGPRSAASRAIPSAAPDAPPASTTADQPQENTRPATQSTKPATKPSQAESRSREERKAAGSPRPAIRNPANSANAPHVNNARPARVVPVAAPSSSVAGQGGAEELGMAEKYLNAHDGKQAAEWLWKSVAKGNVAATITLSDLYLRGDGVTKSCDQARLLLDAAARKGGKGAAERIRNLQAFGCS